MRLGGRGRGICGGGLWLSRRGALLGIILAAFIGFVLLLSLGTHLFYHWTNKKRQNEQEQNQNRTQRPDEYLKRGETPALPKNAVIVQGKPVRNNTRNNNNVGKNNGRNGSPKSKNKNKAERTQGSKIGKDPPKNGQRIVPNQEKKTKQNSSTRESAL